MGSKAQTPPPAGVKKPDPPPPPPPKRIASCEPAIDCESCTIRHLGQTAELTFRVASVPDRAECGVQAGDAVEVELEDGRIVPGHILAVLNNRSLVLGFDANSDNGAGTTPG
jgi:hypothetical protein